MDQRPARTAPAAPLLLAAGLGAALCLGAASPQERDPEQVFEALKRRLDKNLDGAIDRSEWDRNPRVFRRFDVDGDGRITLADVRARTGAGTPGPESAAPVDGPAGDGGPEMTPEALEFFEERIRPVLATHCYSCHSEDSARLKGGLRVDGRAHLLRGGAGGPALVPGDVEGSALIEAVRYEDPLLAMPPAEKLPDEAVRDLETWVRMGAPWPAERAAAAGTVVDTAGGEAGYGTVDVEAGRSFWAFRPVVEPAVPAAAEGDTWALGPIDLFLRAGMESAGTTPVDDADDATWLRRVTFDLTGLPPTPAELESFRQDRSPDRHGRVVDRLLGSRAYAERFGRHWLDVARYGESSGKESNVVYPHAWRYRDWVLDAFEEDMPFDAFVTKQLAGDLLPAADADERAWNLIATGYLAIGPKSHQTRDGRQFKLDLIDEQVDAVSQGMLGLTLSCARCHDHKFDPIPTEDYYAVAGIFHSTETLYGTFRAPGSNQPSGLIELGKAPSVPDGSTMDPTLRRVMERAFLRTEEPSAREMNADRDQARRLARNREQASEVIGSLLERFDDRGRPLPANRLAMGVRDGEPMDLAILERGELDRPRGVAPRGVPQVLTDVPLEIAEGHSGRLELARWIASPENPLTARVWVNRVWLHMFGRGLVATPDNFGASGRAPSHPELLDWLAARFVAEGWSTKRLVREIALSRAYRLDSKGERRNERVDPDLASYWRMPERRLEAEAIRDAMLFVAGSLSPERPVGSPANAMEGTLRREELADFATREREVRSVYMPALRGHVTDAMEAFDAPDAAFVTGARDVTTGATQALYLMNDADVLAHADAFAERLLALKVHDDERIETAFALALSRAPASREVSAVRSFLRDYERAFDAREPEAPAADPRAARRAAALRRRLRERNPLGRPAGPEPLTDGRVAAWSAFCQSLFQSAEFRARG